MHKIAQLVRHTTLKYQWWKPAITYKRTDNNGIPSNLQYFAWKVFCKYVQLNEQKQHYKPSLTDMI